MKTIFILINNSMLIRNILQTDVFKILQKENIQLVVFLPKKWMECCEKKFNYPNVIFEETKKARHSIIRVIFTFLIFSLTTSDTAYLFARYGRASKKRSIFYFVTWYAWAHLFGKSRFVKKCFRFLELRWFPDRQYNYFFDKYKPHLIFSTSILNPVDNAFIKEARRRGIKTIGMPKSWDTLDKRFLRIITDKLIVQNDDTKNILIQEQDVCEKNILVSGFPQFDIYAKKNIFKSREEFLTSLGLDPLRKVIFFGSGGFFGVSDDLIAKELCEFINSNEILYPCSLIVRPHFIKRDTNIKRFKDFKQYPNVFVDNYMEGQPVFNVYTFESMKYLAELLHHSDVMVSPASTLTLDAACLDKPAICVALKNASKKEFMSEISIYKRVIASGGVKVVTSMNELREAVNKYLSNPLLDKEGRENLINQMCYKMDGLSGERITRVLLSEMNQEIYE